MAWTPPAHTPFQWHDAPAIDTPLDAADLMAAETDLVAYTQQVGQLLGLGTTSVKTGAYTAAPGEFVPCDVTTASFSVLLPTAPPDQTRVGVKMVKTAASHTVTINRGGTAIFNVAGGSTSLSLAALFQGVLLQYSAGSQIWYVVTADTPLGQALGAAKLGTDGTVGGAGGSPLVPSVGSVVSGASTHLVPTGGDDTAQMVSALTSFAPFASPYIMLGPGTYLWNTSVPALLRATSTKVTGSGRGQTIIKLSTGAPRFLDCPYVADYDVYSNIVVEDLTVDCNNIQPGSNNHVVIGNLIGGAWAQRANVNIVRVRRVNTINVPTDYTGGAPVRQNISFGSKQSGTTVAAGSNGVNVTTFAGAGTLSVAATAGFSSSGQILVQTSAGTTSPFYATLSYTGTSGGNTFTGVSLVTGSGTLATGGLVMEATQTTLTDIVIEDCNFQGGNYGFAVIGTGATTVNVWLDKNGVDGMVHDTLVVNGAGGAANSAHVQIGGEGFGETAFIWRLIGNRSGDVGTEVDGHMSLSAYACVITDSWNNSYLSCNFHPPRDPYSQRHTYRDCRANTTTALTIPATHACGGWACGSAGVPAASWFGHVLIDGCVHDNANAAFNANGFAVSTQTGAGIRRVTLRNFETNTPSVSQTLGAIGGCSPLYFNPSAQIPFTLSLDDVRINVAGTTNLAGFTFASYGLWVNGSDATGADITVETGRPVVFDWNMAGVAAGNTQLARFGPTAAPAVVPKFRGSFKFTVGSFAGGDTSPYGLFVADSQGAGTPLINLDTQIVCRDCDAKNLPVGSAGSTGQIGREISWLGTRGGASTGQYNVFTPGVRLCQTGSAAGAPRAASPGTLSTGSTFVNKTGSAMFIWFTGAITTTAIAVGVRSDTSLSTVTGQTGNGPYFLSPAGAIQWTGTGGPATINYILCPI